MANDTASVTLALTYTRNGQTITIPTKRINAPFQAYVDGDVDVPDATAGDTEIAIPMGSIGTGATLVVLENDTGQDLKVEIAGAAAPSHDLPDGGFAVILAAAELPAARKLTALSIHTTGVQAGAGKVRFHVFGDPT